MTAGKKAAGKKAAGKKAVGDADKEITCPSCGAVADGSARFCQACGAALSGGAQSGAALSGGENKKSGGVPWTMVAVIAGLAVVVTGAVTAMVMFTVPDPARQQTNTQASSQTGPQAASAPSSGTPPDISNMSPRQAADRLFNRVMMASEQGRPDEALQFAPMAVEAYNRVEALDRDAHFHLALIHSVTGDKLGLDWEISLLRQGAPNHLLALFLEHEAAKRAGEAGRAATAAKAFAAAYEAEIAIPRPEYAEHRNLIEAFKAGLGK